MSLAAQTLSSSVATGLQLFHDLNVPQFADVEGTIHFVRLIDNIFDVINVMHPNCNGFKQAIRPGNLDQIKAFCDYAEGEIYQMVDKNGDDIVYTRKSTGFLGLIFCMRSLMHLSSYLLSREHPRMHYVLSYKFSQDHLELLFNCIRGSLGWNDNPTPKQFIFIYRRLLVHAGVDPTSSGNCVDLATLPESNPIEPQLVGATYLSRFVTNVTTYIAGFVVRSILPRIRCVECRTLIVSTDVKALNADERHLIELKNNGGLVVPSKDVTKVVQLCEGLCRERSLPRPAEISLAVINHILNNNNYFSNAHFSETDHSLYIIRSVINTYLKIRLNHLCKSVNVARESNRYRLHKQIHFRSE